MKYSAVIAVAVSAAAAHAQLSGIPTCASTCVSSGITSVPGCTGLDIACICKSEPFITELTKCVSAACDAADVATTAEAAKGLCASAGVTLNIPPAPVAPAGTTAPAHVTVAPYSTVTPAGYYSSSAPVYISSSSCSETTTAAVHYTSPVPVYHSSSTTPCTSAGSHYTSSAPVYYPTTTPCANSTSIKPYTVYSSSCTTPVTLYTKTSSTPCPTSTPYVAPPHYNATVPVPVATTPAAYTGAASSVTVLSSVFGLVAAAAAALML